LEWAKDNLSHDDFKKFQELGSQRLETIPLHLLRAEEKPTPNVTMRNAGPNSRIESQVDTRKA